MSSLLSPKSATADTPSKSTISSDYKQGKYDSYIWVAAGIWLVTAVFVFIDYQKQKDPNNKEPTILQSNKFLYYLLWTIIGVGAVILFILFSMKYPFFAGLFLGSSLRN